MGSLGMHHSSYSHLVQFSYTAANARTLCTVGLRPEDENALKYKEAVEQRLHVAQPSTASDGGYSTEPAARHASPVEKSRGAHISAARFALVFFSKV